MGNWTYIYTHIEGLDQRAPVICGKGFLAANVFGNTFRGVKYVARNFVCGDVPW